MSRKRSDTAVRLGLGCTDHGCIWGHDGGMGTNGGCHCLIAAARSALLKVSIAVRDLTSRIRQLEEAVGNATGLLESLVRHNALVAGETMVKLSTSQRLAQAALDALRGVDYLYRLEAAEREKEADRE